MTSLRSEVGGVIEASWRPLRREDWPSRVMMLSLPGLIMILYKEPILIITSQGYLSQILTSEVSLSDSTEWQAEFSFFTLYWTVLPSQALSLINWEVEEKKVGVDYWRAGEHVLQLLRNGGQRWHKYQIIHSINICNCHRTPRQLFSHPVTGLNIQLCNLG